MQGLIALSRKHKPDDINKACDAADRKGGYYLNSIKEELGSTETQPELSFLETHDVIRDLTDYNQYILPLTTKQKRK